MMTQPPSDPVVPAFKAAQLRYRRDPQAPDRLDDRDDWIDFGRDACDGKHAGQIVSIQLNPPMVSKKDSQIEGDSVIGDPIESTATGNCVNHEPVDGVSSTATANEMSLEELSLSIPSSPMPFLSQSQCYRGPVYGLREFPGFLYCPAAMSPALQLELAFDAVSKYSEPPQRTNVDLHTDASDINVSPSKESSFPSPDTFWSVYKQQRRERPSASSSTVPISSTKPTQQPKPKSEHPHTASKCSINSTTSHARKSFDRLSWATLGYHYDWTARYYHPDTFTPIPLLIHRICAPFAAVYFQMQQQSTTSSSTPPDLEITAEPHGQAPASTRALPPFTASACICNYYHAKSIMGGHRDDSEYALDKPIVSFSMGRPCLFLLGQDDREATPIVPIVVRPGDVMILGGASRLNYHAMVRLLPAEGLPLPSVSCLVPEDKNLDACRRRHWQVPATTSRNDEDFFEFRTVEDEEALAEFLSTHRINFNARQVYRDGEDPRQHCHSPTTSPSTTSFAVCHES